MRFLLAVGIFAIFVPTLPAAISIPPLPKEKKQEKKKEQETPMPPLAVPVTVQVVNGGSAQILLRVYGRQEQATSFLIRKEPQLGKIVSLQPLEQEVWVLTYQHTAPMNGQADAQDSILFAAQNKNGTSAAAEITLNIVDNPPELEPPGAVEFGEIPAGVPATRSVSIANKGGGILEGAISADTPWSVEPASYRLARGEKAELRLTLAPESEREYRGRLHFSTHPKAEPALHASASAPFAIQQQMLELTSPPGTHARSGSCTILNRTGSELTLHIEGNARLALPATLTLPPHAASTLAVGLAENDSGGFEDSIRLSLGTIFRLLPVHAAPGARPSPAPASPTPSPSPSPIPTPTPVPTPKTAVPHSALDRPAEEVDPAALNAVVAKAIGETSSLPKLRGFTFVRASSAGTAEFSWEPPASSGERQYQMQVRRLSLDAKGKLLQNWIPVPEVRFTTEHGRVTALITGIPPGIRDTARAVALDSGGGACAESYPCAFYVPTPVRIFTPRNCLLGGFVLLLGGALGAQWLQKKRSR